MLPILFYSLQSLPKTLRMNKCLQAGTMDQLQPLKKKIHGDEYGAVTIKTISGNQMKCKLCFNNKRKEVFPQTEIPSLSTILSLTNLKLTGKVFQRNKNGG